MTAQEYLRQYQQMKHRIRDLLEERQRWENLALRITPSYSSVVVSASAGAGKIATSIEQIEEWECKLDEQISEQLRIRKEIEEAVSRIENGDYQTLLRLRYILGYGWDRIAEEMHYTVRWTMKMHLKALDAFKEDMERHAPTVI